MTQDIPSNADLAIIAESKAAEATNSAANYEEASQRATAAHTTKAITDAMTSFFSAQTEKERFISTQRIPFICADIRAIKEDFREVVRLQADFQEKVQSRLDTTYVTQEAFWPVRTLVYSFVAIVLSSVVLALVALVVMTH